jgi:hypothetical protein
MGGAFGLYALPDCQHTDAASPPPPPPSPPPSPPPFPPPFPPPPPKISPAPAFEYHYWKCYYPAGTESFKAAALYSVEVDYYTFGACRLASNGAYYCGMLSTLAPFKGMSSTADTPHIGTDPTTVRVGGYGGEGGRLHAGPATGTTGTKTGAGYAGTWGKVHKPANPDYYSSLKPVASAEWQYNQKATNNGLELDNPSKLFINRAGHAPEAHDSNPDVTAVYNQATNYKSVTPGYDPTVRFANDARASNYGMTRGEAKAYNEPIHVVGAAGSPSAKSDLVYTPISAAAQNRKEYATGATIDHTTRYSVDAGVKDYR